MKNIVQYKNWIEWPKDSYSPIINIYPMFSEYPKSLKEALVLQAKMICENIENVSVFFSGGIDSQQVAWAFKEAGVDVEYIFLLFIHEGLFNKEEYFFANEFAKRFDIDYKIKTIDTSDMLVDKIVKEFNYFEKEAGFGAVLQQYGFKKHIEEHPEKNIVTGAGLFTYKRIDDTCYGMIPNLFSGKMSGYGYDEHISFYFYTPAVFQYYEYLHKNDRELQYLKRYQPKHLAYTELGWNFRPKMNSWEHFSRDDYEDQPLVNYADDHDIPGGWNGTKSYLEHSSYSEKDKIRLIKQKKAEHDFRFYQKDPEGKGTSYMLDNGGYYSTLYEFKTEVVPREDLVK
tara:strand:+ start:6833 stop:7858 length:1026 start_codon:yes stop_codon:yes gene_type:complete